MEKVHVISDLTLSAQMRSAASSLMVGCAMDGGVGCKVRWWCSLMVLEFEK